ncbi:MAG: SDR family oxidoreductase [Acidimicrobiales bacterium]|nr:SDR family oxidoreductase [Acidimicrobiales bacterium]
MGRFDDKVVLVTGASTGIGRASAQRLANEGASLFLLDINQPDLDAHVVTLNEQGVDVGSAVVDVRSDAQVAAAVLECVERFGRLDGLANIAGVQTWRRSHEITTEDFRRDIDINLIGTFIVCREAIPHLLESRGAIVNMSSTTAFAGIPYSAAYSASKGGVLAMTRSLAIEYAKEGLRVNCICPGGIRTPMTDGAMAQFPEGADMQLLLRQMSLDGQGEPEDIANMVAMLLSEEARHVNGTSITIDGAATA